MGITAAQHAEQLHDYLADGATRALLLDNRGPIRFDKDGSLHADIVQAYSRTGFYVFTQVLDAAELVDLRDELEQVLARAPYTKKARTDRHGQPAIGADLTIPPFHLVKPLADPVGGTKHNGGRHQVPMVAPDAAADAPDYVVQVIFGTLHIMDSCLRLYGHPQLLKVAEQINGADFTPFNEAIFVKQPGLGASVAWHQDGTTHWDKPDFDEGTHGFNFMAQLYKSTAANGVWVVPGTHRQGKVDIAELLSEAGSEQIPGAVPLICEPGDTVICNRQLVHGSFANTSSERRASVGFGFHRRRSIIGARAKLLNGEVVHYDEARVNERSRMIAIGIDARQQKYPEETPFKYQPLVGLEEHNRFSEQNRKAVINNYNLLDLHI
mgnify:CR=1 FL=1